MVGQTMCEKSDLDEFLKITFQPSSKQANVKRGTTVLEAAISCGVHITSSCGGRGKCGKCKVIIQNQDERPTALSEVEIANLSSEDKKKGYRLACELRPNSNTLVVVPSESQARRDRLQIQGVEVNVKPHPAVKKYFVKVPRPTLQDNRSDDYRLIDALHEQHGLSDLTFDYEEMRKLPISLRKNDWEATVAIRNGNLIVAVEPGNTSDRCFGFAVDVGTTKLAGYLVDLITGKRVGSESIVNPQTIYGADLMTRITYINDDLKRLDELQKAVVNGINKMIADACNHSNVAREEIYDVTAAGNTCMQTLLLGILPKYLGRSPYPPIIKRSTNVKSSWLGVQAQQNANFYLAPVIGGFVGGDNVAAILSSHMLESEKITLLIDVGTNTEIDLGNVENAMTCSCPSGPAFEGAHIEHGMVAASGAIERVSIEPVNFEVHYKTIDDLPPIGICGSALIDAVAEFLKVGIIDKTGRFTKSLESKCSRIRKGKYGYEFTLAFPEETGLRTSIVITQKDIGELQKAKAATFAGSSILMQRMGVTTDTIDRLIIAGAFGSYVNPENARTIGMYPEVPLDKVMFIGNAAGTGAQMMLKSKRERTKAEEISRRVKHHELSTDTSFATEFAKAMYLPNKDPSKFPSTFRLLERFGRTT
jgi:uncharacterized 2Fe-2S/4Fe-4S cluster protein (DUF4445 family)